MNLENFELNEDDRVVILGIGNKTRGDDAAGIRTIQKLEDRLESENLLLINTGNTPEKFTSKVKKFEPDKVLLIDSIDSGSEPGTITLAKSSDVSSYSVSTHRLPLSKLMDYLEKETGAKIRLLGMQVENIGRGTKISQNVKESIDEIVEKLSKKMK